VFPFDKDFAKLQPELATEIFGYNIQQAGMTPADAEGLKDLPLAQANSRVVARAGTKAIAPAIELVGYDYDAAFPTLIRRLLPPGNGLKGFVLAAIFGAVVSSLAAMLNSSSTIFAIDIFGKLKKDASQFQLVTVGRICVVVFVVIAMIIAPTLDNPKFKGVFTFIQEFQGFISPGILAIFLFGVLVHKAPRACGTIGLILNPILYGGLKWADKLPGIGHTSLAAKLAGLAFLNRMAVCFFVVLGVLTVLRLVIPLPKPVDLPVNDKINLESKADVKVWGVVVVVLTLALYAIFW
jgi:SSS family solute:Na+ symporter